MQEVLISHDEFRVAENRNHDEHDPLGSLPGRGGDQRTESGMSSDQLNEYLRGLGWSGAELARRLGVTPKAVSEWRRGKRQVPGPVRAYVRLVAAITVALREGKEGPP